jgi:hypothetical protein
MQKSIVPLLLFSPLLEGNAPLGNYSDVLGPTWERSIARRCGFKIGTAELSAEYLTRRELDDFFLRRMLSEIREMGSGMLTWQGLILKMSYTRGGQTFENDFTDRANAWRAIYTRTFDNLLTNGSAEGSVWAAINGATVTKSTEWVADGLYSAKIVVADSTVRGATIQATIAITASTSYNFNARLNVVSGSFRIALNRVDNNQSLAFFSTRGTHGVMPATFNVPSANGYTGNATLVVTSEGSAGTIYIDGCLLTQAPITNSDTGWSLDTRAIASYGRKEDILLLSGMSDASALSKCQSALLDRAWPQPRPPKTGKTRSSANTGMDKITITFAGYWATLNWLFVLTGGTAAASAQVTTLVAQQSTYLTAGSIKSNTLSYTIDTRQPLRVGDELKKICDAGASNGALWHIGVYANRQLSYGAVPTDLSYHIVGDDLTDVAGGEITPWLARPGWANWDDLPLGPHAPSGVTTHDPRLAYLEEITMQADGSLAYSCEDNG